jgi:PTS system N-acetylglucosamine-specific IIC component
VVGPIADQVASEMRAAAGPLAAPSAMAAPTIAVSIARADAEPWLAALGGRGNVVEAGAASSRIWLKLHDLDKVDAAALKALGTRAIATPGKDVVHLIVGADAEPIAAALLQ